MKAMILERFKEPMAYREVPDPAIGSEDILKLPCSILN